MTAPPVIKLAAINPTQTVQKVDIMKTQEFELEYKRKRPPFNSGWCNIRVYEHEGKTIVVASEVIKADGDYANEGMSVINAVEIVAQCVAERGIRFDVFIEHLPLRGSKWGVDKEDFSTVTFEKASSIYADMMFAEAQFKFIDRARVEVLIGQVFEDGLTEFRPK